MLWNAERKLSSEAKNRNCFFSFMHILLFNIGNVTNIPI